MDKKELRYLYDQAENLGLRLSQHHLDLFLLYLNELEYWNQKMNLTGLTEPRRILNDLLLDSLIPISILPKEGKMLDIGSGAGFPAIPIKIINPSLRIQLIEASSKKASFLKQVIRLLKLDDIHVIRERIEECNNIPLESYDLVTARAFASFEETISSCYRFLSSDGILLCFLGNNAEKYLIENKHIMEKYSIYVHKKLPYALPGKINTRYDIFLKKKSKEE